MEVAILLDEKQIKCAALIAQGMPFTEIAKELVISRQTIYNWKQVEEFAAEVDKYGQEFIYEARGRLKSAAKLAADEVIKLLKNGKYEKTRFAAAQDILDRNLGKATTRMEVDDNRKDKDHVPIDVLDAEMEEVDNE